MADSPREEPAGEQTAAPPVRRVDPADEAERAFTPRTPARTLAGVWLVVAGVFALILLAVVLILYLA
jgi:hypothetical protein